MESRGLFRRNYYALISLYKAGKSIQDKILIKYSIKYLRQTCFEFEQSLLYTHNRTLAFRGIVS